MLLSDLFPGARFLGHSSSPSEIRQTKWTKAIRIQTCVVILFWYCLADSGFAQQPSSTILRDPQAIGIITQSLNAVGGPNAVTAIQDMTATGTISFNWANQPSQGSVTVKGRGLSQFRLDATFSDGVRSWVIGNGTAQEQHPDGSITPMPLPYTIKPVSLTFPYIQLVAAIQDTSWSISNLGPVTHDGQQEYDIRVQKIFPKSSDPSGYQSLVTKTDFFVDPKTFLILGVQDRAFAKDGAVGGSLHEMEFSNYQAVNGILIPFSVTELISGQQTMMIQFAQIIFNSGLTDSDFAL